MSRGSAARTAAIGSMRADPEKPCARVRPWTVIIAAPASTSARANSGALSEHSSQPARCLTVTGIRAGTARRTAPTSSAASAGSRINAEPHAPAVTFLAGQPMLMSTIDAPTSAAIAAARASASGSRPKICTAKRRAPKLGHMRPSALAAPRVSASADRNSVNVRIAPSSSQTVRKGRSVTASIGASKAPGLSCTSAMRIGGRENSTALVAVLMFASGVAAGACRKAALRASAPAVQTQAQPETAEALLAGVVDPWRWPRAAGAKDQARAVEDIGPYEHARPDDATSPLVNTNAHYWTALAGYALYRVRVIDFDCRPADV